MEIPESDHEAVRQQLREEKQCLPVFLDAHRAGEFGHILAGKHEPQDY